MDVGKIVVRWGSEDRANLWKILTKSDSGVPEDPDAFAEELRWLYHNRSRKEAQQAAVGLYNRAAERLGSKSTKRKPEMEELAPALSYEAYMRHALGHMKIDWRGADLATQERYLADAVILIALQRLTAEHRKELFDSLCIDERKAATDDVTRESFARHTAVSNATGLLTQAVGLVLPFALTTGFATTFAWLAGPPGWLGLSFWAFLRFTGPKWDRIVAALLYIASVEGRPASNTEPTGAPI